MIHNVDIINEYTNYYGIIAYGDDGVEVGKVRKKDVFPNTIIFMEIQIKNYLNNGVIELC